MNYRMVINVLGKAMLAEAVLLFVPFIYGVALNEGQYLSFLLPMAILFAVGVPFSLFKFDDRSIYAKEGFVIVALAWIILSLVGTLPFIISKSIPNFIDALFETISGFTTTGASVLNGEQLETMPRSVMFWRMLTHWLGGMGVLVFVLAVLPNANGGIMHVFRAESPGPSAGKFVGKLKNTARILYGIYVILTVLEALLLLIGGMPAFDAILSAFSTAGTGGFSIHDGSIAYYNSAYSEIVIAIFMFLFGINFNVFYLILTGYVLKAFKSEEFIFYVLIVLTSSVTIAVNIIQIYGNFWIALRYSFFQVNTLSSTTGFSTCDFIEWPTLSKALMLFLTVVGASGGSTGGGLKVSRLCILFKTAVADIKRLIKPRSVVAVKFEGKPLSHETQRNVNAFFIIYVIIVGITTILLSFDGFGDIFTNFSATLACISNVGPGLTDLIGPMSSYAGYSAFSKIILSVVMLAGRLEIFPLIIFFAPRTWKKGL